jgi:GT2 family glycosyltransferase
MNVNPLDHPICLSQPRRKLSSTWMEHVPFAMYLVDLIRPKVVVELGTFYGVSYCAFCQAVEALNLKVRCYAIDSWEGDPHMGEYPADVLDNLRAHHDPLYGAFSTLMQTTFDEALHHFDDGSIDLLHIDGYHTYEAVSHDFHSWLPKVSQDGVVLLHDINVRQEDFGVWKLWEELEGRYPHFEFEHGYGLGLVAVGEHAPSGLLPWLYAGEEEQRRLRLFFADLGRRVSLEQAARERPPGEASLRAEDHSRARTISVFERQLEDARQELRQLEEALSGTQERLSSREQALEGKEEQVSALLSQQRVMEAQATADQRELGQLRETAAQFELLRDAFVVRLLQRYRTAIERLLPNGTRRRRIYGSLIKAARAIISLRPSPADVARRAQPTGMQPGLKPAAEETSVDSYDLVRKTPGGAAPQPSAGDARLDEDSQQSQPDDFKNRPLISVLIPVYNTPARYLEAAIKSVQSQAYSRVEICIHDDGSTDASTRQALTELLAADPSIRFSASSPNVGISAATNAAGKLATGDFVAFLDHDDELSSDALFEVVRALNQEPGFDALYSDQDKIGPDGGFEEPFFKPDWSPVYLQSVMYVGHLLMVRRQLFEQLGGFDSSFDGVQDYEFMLRLSETAAKVKHLPSVLYHWRKAAGSIALDLDSKGAEIEELQARAVNAHLARLGIAAAAVSHPDHRHRVKVQPRPRPDYPLVSIIVTANCLSNNLDRCLASIAERTTYPNYEVVLVDLQAEKTHAPVPIKDHSVRVVSYGGSFNFSRANNLGVQSSRGDLVILMSEDMEVLSPDWIEIMLSFLEQKGIGIVGPLVVYPDQTVQHAGLVLGIAGAADAAMRHFPSGADGYSGSLSCPREVSAVTAAGMMLRRQDYLDHGGLVDYYGAQYQDVDLCLRVRATGKSVLFVPHAVLVRPQGAAQCDPLDRALLLDTWGAVIARGDPFYNPNFSLETADYALRAADRA